MKVKSSKKETNFKLEQILDFFRVKDVSMLDTLPIKKVLANGIIVDKDNHYQAFLKIKTTDLTSLSSEDFNRTINKFTYLLRVYTEPLKIVSLTYPTEVLEQLAYWKYRIDYTKKKLYALEKTLEYETYSRKEEYLRNQLTLTYENYNRITYVGTLKELTFLFVVYGKTQAEVVSRIQDIKGYGGRELDLELLDKENVTTVLHKLNNMNSKE